MGSSQSQQPTPSTSQPSGIIDTLSGQRDASKRPSVGAAVSSSNQRSPRPPPHLGPLISQHIHHYAGTCRMILKIKLPEQPGGNQINAAWYGKLGTSRILDREEPWNNGALNTTTCDRNANVDHRVAYQEMTQICDNFMRLALSFCASHGIGHSTLPLLHRPYISSGIWDNTPNKIEKISFSNDMIDFSCDFRNRWTVCMKIQGKIAWCTRRKPFRSVLGSGFSQADSEPVHRNQNEMLEYIYTSCRNRGPIVGLLKIKLFRTETLTFPASWCLSVEDSSLGMRGTSRHFAKNGVL